MSNKFRLLNGSEIPNDSGITDHKCTTSLPISEIIYTINQIGCHKIALIWVSSDLIDVVYKCVHYDSSYTVPELTRHDFIGHLAKVVTFCSDILEPRSYRIFLKSNHIDRV